jgi:hypothetical protein
MSLAIFINDFTKSNQDRISAVLIYRINNMNNMTPYIQ